MALRTARRRSPIPAPTGVGVFAMRRWAHRTSLAGLFLAALTACGAVDRTLSRSARAVTDDAGRRVALAHPAERIVSLSPSATELLFAIGVGDRVVGRTTWCDYPPAARAVPSVGDGLNPNIEAIAARRPDLVVLYRSQVNETAARQLTRLGIAAALLRQDRLEDVTRAARLLGRLTGRTASGDSLAEALARLVERPVAPGPARVRLAFIVWDNPPIVIGAGSYLDQLAALAGAVNVFHDIGAASAQVALETIATRDPDAVAVLSDSARLPAYARRREWQAVRAIRERRFIYLPGSLFGRPSPRAAEAVAELRRRLEAEGAR